MLQGGAEAQRSTRGDLPAQKQEFHRDGSSSPGRVAHSGRLEERLRGPDFFLVGAPKSGTTAMAKYLGEHPEIGMAARKEVHYFGTDLHPRMVRRKRLTRTLGRWDPGREAGAHEHYLRLFSAVQGRRRLGEASVWYLYSRTAAVEIAEFAPDAQIIAMIRNPIEMLPSLHSQLVRVGIEPVEDFAEALALDEERERSGAPQGFAPRSYRSAVRYSEQIKRYLDVFGTNNVSVILYEDFRDHTLDVYRRACRFLGVDSAFVPDLAVVNPNRRVRSRAVRRLIWQPPDALRRLLRSTVSQPTRIRIGAALKRWNTRPVRREPAPADVVRSLRPIVAEEADELGALLGIDLSFWLEGSAPER